MDRTDSIEVTVKESFIITNIGVVVYLRHLKNGLPLGSHLLSIETGKSWSVYARVLSEHAITIHKKFDCEHIEYALIHFSSPEKMLVSRKKIEQEENHGIFQYIIKPIDHVDKPLQGEILKYIDGER